MSKSVSFEDYLAQHGTLTYSNTGTSMEPLLRQGRDLFTVTRKTGERCRVGDVVLFRRGENYVLHRVIAVREADYVTLGDNAVNPEYGVREEDILGVMSSFVRRGKEHRANAPLVRAYTALWLCTRPARVLLKRTLARWKGRRTHE